MTVSDNLLTVCSACHRNLHNGKLKIERNRHRLRYTDKAGRSLRVFRPEPAPDWALTDGLDAGDARPGQEDCWSASEKVGPLGILEGVSKKEQDPRRGHGSS